MLPAQAGIGDAFAINQRCGIVCAGGEFLRASQQVALYHHTKNMARAGRDLGGNVARHIQLLFMLLAAVGMAAVHHQRGRQFGLLQILTGSGHAARIVIGRFAATQNHMAVRVAQGLHNRHLPIFMHR